jgi:high affinity Mn2+ porin
MRVELYLAAGVLAIGATGLSGAIDAEANGPAAVGTALPATTAEQQWNWHAQSTVVGQGDPSFPAKYSGPNSLDNSGEIRETVSVDLYAGLRLWRGGEAHIDGLLWQGFGLSKAVGVNGYPNGEAFRLGTYVPNVNIPRLFLRQTIGLGVEQEAIEDDALHMVGREDVSRLTLTLGRMNAKDIFDGNAYGNDPRTQFMNWGLMANEAWDFPADSLGFITGFAAELNQPRWTLRYGIFQMPKEANGVAIDAHVLQAWGMVTELERRFTLKGHAGAVRLLAFLNRAHMGSYQGALDSTNRPADIEATRDYRYKYGFGLNMEQEIARNVGIFSRLGWSDGHTEAWAFSDVDRTATLGVSIKGESWHRPKDTFGLGGVLNGLSRVHQEFFAAGGLGILAGDGALSYDWERILETYYDFQIWKSVHATLDYQYITNPAFNRDRGPVSVFAARLHWEF